MNLAYISSNTSADAEAKFYAYKERYPDILRIHGVESSQALGVAAHAFKGSPFTLLLETEAPDNPDNVVEDLVTTPDFLTSKPLKKSPILDIVYLSYAEANAEESFSQLKSRFPRVKRLHRVKGMTLAFRLSAHIVDTEYYILIDGDNEVLPDFDLNDVSLPDKPNTFGLYMAQNPVNDLVYGYGGVKICPTVNFRNITDDRLDPVASGGIEKLQAFKIVASVTRFNTSPFNAWKAGFREATMMVSQDVEVSMRQEEINQRLAVWKTKGSDRPYGDWAILGAIQGERYGLEHRRSLTDLAKINDPEWLAMKFREVERS